MAEAPLVAVLAAGRGTRFGGGKLEAPCAGRPLGRWALDAVADAGLPPGLIVTGPEGASFAAGWTRLINPQPDAGLGSSLALAARMALEGGARSLLVLLADMPLVASAYLRELAAAPAPAATRHPDGHAGVPALLNHALVKKATELSGDRGAASLLRRAKLLDPPADSLFDVDTHADLAEAERILLSHLRHPRESGDPASFRRGAGEERGPRFRGGDDS